MAGRGTRTSKRTERCRIPAMLKPIVSRSLESRSRVWCSRDSIRAPWPCILAAESWSWYIRSAKKRHRDTSSTCNPSRIQRSKNLKSISICVSGSTRRASSRPAELIPRSVRSRYLNHCAHGTEGTASSATVGCVYNCPSAGLG